MAASSCVITPRTITVACWPKPDPAVECVSSARSFWGGTKALKSRVRAPSYSREREFDGLEIDVEYTRRTKGETHEFIRGRFDSREDWTAITDAYPMSSGWLYDFFRFRDQLRGGQAATLVYRSGWGGLIIAIPAALAVILLLWQASGSSTLVHRVDERIVETQSKNYWHSRAQRRRLSRDDVEDAVVTAAADAKGRTVYRPALRLGSGELVEFGTVGGLSPARPEHLVRQIRELLELPDRPIATIDQRVSTTSHDTPP